jgi:hypothetical protein
MGCPAKKDPFEGISLGAPLAGHPPQVHQILHAAKFQYSKEPALVALPDRKFLVDAAGLVL